MILVAPVHVAMLAHGAIWDLRTRSYPNRALVAWLLAGLVLCDYGSLGGLNLLVAGLGVAAWRLGGLGGADAKALLVLAVTAPGPVAVRAFALMWPLALALRFSLHLESGLWAPC